MDIMDIIQYYYRFLIDNVPAPDGWVEHNEDSFPVLMERFISLRELNPRAIVRMEVSPWFRVYPYNKVRGYTECPGCDYASCPVGGK